jgi:hypothetical protein
MGIFIVSLLVFFAIAFFLPEWLGITGNKAKDIMRHQQGDEEQPHLSDTASNPQNEVPSPEAKGPRHQ